METVSRVERNVGGLDQVIRFLVGALLIIIGFAVHMGFAWRLLTFVLGGYGLATSWTGYCPVNRVLRVNTRRTEGPRIAGRSG
jgi:hypothetical protein